MSSKKHAKGFKASSRKTSSQKKNVIKRRSLLFQGDSGNRPERKNIDVSTSFTTGAAFAFSAGQLMNGCAAGTGATNRVGRKISMKVHQFRCAVNSNAGNAGNARILVVYDKQTNGAAPAITDILAADLITAPMNLSNADRFVVIHDVITEGPTDITTTWHEKHFKKMGLETLFGNTGSAVTDINSGSVYMFVAGGTGSAITVNLYSRIRFVDA